jgi:hypothetical protein
LEAAVAVTPDPVSVEPHWQLLLLLLLHWTHANMQSHHAPLCTCILDAAAATAAAVVDTVVVGAAAATAAAAAALYPGHYTGSATV